MSDDRPEAESVGELFGRLIEDARDVGQAEFDYWRTFARRKLREARSGLWWGAAAISLALAASVALVVGLVLTLSPIVGPGFATLIVVLGIGAVSAIMGRLAWLAVKKVFGPEK